MKTTITITNATHGKLIDLLIKHQEKIDEYPSGNIQEGSVVLTWSTVMGGIEHQLKTAADCGCSNPYCPICEGGLSFCKVCEELNK